MRRHHRLYLLIGLALLGGAGGLHYRHSPPDYTDPAIAGAFRSDVVDTHGRLSVRGTQLVDERGAPVILRGLAAHGPQWFPLVDGWSIPSMVRMFGVDAVRIPMYIEAANPADPSDRWGGYTVNQGYMLERLRAGVEDALDAGIYVLIDWHIHDDPTLYTEEAVAFFDRISAEYGEHPNVIYEICNEPAYVGWPEVKRYAEAVIPAIRRNDPDNLILVGTPTWSQDIDAPADDPLAFEGIMYTVHYYAGNHPLDVMLAKVDYALGAGLPVFVSEWGSSDVMNTTSNFAIAEVWVAALEARGLSWLSWSLGNKDEPSSALTPEAPLSGPWTEADLTEAGRWLLPYFRPEVSP